MKMRHKGLPTRVMARKKQSWRMDWHMSSTLAQRKPYAERFAEARGWLDRISPIWGDDHHSTTVLAQLWAYAAKRRHLCSSLLQMRRFALRGNQVMVVRCALGVLYMIPEVRKMHGYLIRRYLGTAPHASYVAWGMDLIPVILDEHNSVDLSS
jgi:hypothetical protein